jgi:lipoprotein signal peptidase
MISSSLYSVKLTTNILYSHYILNTGHSFGSLEDSLQILNIQQKGPYLYTLEKYHRGTGANMSIAKVTFKK